MPPSLLYPSSDTHYEFQHHNDTCNYTAFRYQRHPQYLHVPLFVPSEQYCCNSRIMAERNSGDMEDMQRLSDNWRPDLPGPLIGEKLSMSVLTAEYAQADRLYVLKTATLERNYSAYRAVKGDGQCGWRGAVFAYFETLLHFGDLDLVQQERVRLQTFEDAIRMAGIDFDILSDMFEFTWELFDALEKAMEQDDKSDATILNFLNDEITSNSIVYHFKIMTAAYMQLHPDQYEPFLDVSIAEYRAMRIEASDQEIDQIALQALTDAVIQPADFGLEVLYLDRSDGEEATPHPFVPGSADKPTIRLLYRPGHYDVIYKKTPTPAPVPSYQVFLQQANLIPQPEMPLHPDHAIPGWMQPFFLTGPPGSESNYWHGGSGSSSDRQNDSQCLFSPYPQPTSFMSSVSNESSNIQSLPHTNLDYSTNYPLQYGSPSSTDMSSPIYPTTPLLATRAIPSAQQPTRDLNELQIRLSASCYGYSQKHESMPLCNQAYGSAATLSTAHFRNQDFQPQIWRAEDEYSRFP